MADTPTTTPHRRRLLLILAAALALIAAVLVYEARVRILSVMVEHEALRALEEAGLSPVAIGAVEATFRGASLRNVAIGRRQGVRVETIEVNYSPLSVLRGKISSVVLSGAALSIVLDTTGRLDAGPLAGLKSDTRERGGAALPAGRLEVRDGQVTIVAPGGTFLLPFELVATQRDAAVSIRANAWPEGSPVSLEATVQPEPLEATVSLRARDLDVALARQIVTMLGGAVPLTVDGRVGARGEAAFRKGAWSARCVVESERIALYPEGGDSTRPSIVEALDLTASVQPDGAWSANLAAASTGGPLAIEAAGRVPDDTLRLKITWNALDLPAFLATSAGALAPPLPVKECRLSIAGELSRATRDWRGSVRLSSSHLALAMPFAGTVREVKAAHASVDIELAEGSAAAIDSRAVIFGAPLAVSGTFATDRPESDTRIRMTNLNGRNIDQFCATFVPDIRTRSAGRLDATAQVTISGDQGKVAALLKAQNLTIEGQSGTTGFALQPDTVSASAALARKRSGIVVAAGRVRVAGLSVAVPSQDLVLDDVGFTVPLTVSTDGSRPGTFSVGSLSAGGQKIPPLSGTHLLDSQSVSLNAVGYLAEGAPINLAGSLSWSTATIDGRIDAEVPPFTAPDNRMLGRWFPMFAKAETGGWFSGSARLWMHGDSVASQARLSLRDGYWRDRAARTGAEGIGGTVNFSSLAPLAAVATQRLAVDTAWSGSFGLRDLALDFRMRDSTIMIDSAWGSWGDGMLLAQGLHYRENATRVAFDIEARGIELQSLFDFLDYHDVSGTGSLYGTLPVRVDWTRRTHLSFGNGRLEARPAKGTLRLSHKTAMMVLGIRRPIPADTKDTEKVAQLMMLRALEDMEYSDLRAEFSTGPSDKWVTRVSTKGYGPRGAKENRVPVGGLNINVNDLDDLLNSLIIPRPVKR